LYLKRLAPINYRPKSSLALLIRTQERVEGVIFFDNAKGFQSVPQSDLKKLERFKEHAVTAFSKALILKEVEQKTDQIESAYRKISDSIRYASRIQQAILPKAQEVESNFADSFIFYKPRDIVSGDFYWYAETVPEPIYTMEKDRDGKLTSVFSGFTDIKSVLAVVDCTGHGVPGAFMTVIGNDLLTAIVVEEKIDKAHKILERLDKNVKMYLKQEGNQQARDGMDMALIVIDSLNNTVEFAGAKNPLYHYRNGQLTEYKGAKYPIGGVQIQKKVFETQTIAYEEGDIFYMFSDGFPDQFGGAVAGGEDRKYGSRRFRELLTRIHTLPMSEQRAIVEKELDMWQNGNKQTDDILVMGIKM
jgi:serine phosphatase RsbU (regulator of sigma subunit)